MEREAAALIIPEVTRAPAEEDMFKAIAVHADVSSTSVIETLNHFVYSFFFSFHFVTIYPPDSRGND